MQSPVANRLGRTLLCACCGLLGAQSPLLTTFAANTVGPLGGALYYEASFGTTVTLTGATVHCASAPGTVGTIEVWAHAGPRAGTQLNAAAWTLVGTATVTSAGRDLPTNVPVAPGSVYSAGSTVSFAVRSTNLRFAYTALPAPTTWATAEMSLTAGEATNQLFVGPLQTGAINLSLSYLPGSVLAGNECATAQPLGIGTQGPYSNAGYTTSASPGPFSCTAADRDRWFRFVAPQDADYTVDTCGLTAGDTVLQLYSDTCAGPFNFGCNDNACGLGSSATLHMVPGSAFLIRIGSRAGGTATPWSGNVTVRMADDECTGALPVSAGTSSVMSNVGYTDSAPPIPCASTGRDRWFRFTPPSSGVWTFHTCTAARTLDTVLEVLGGGCAGLVSLGCNDDDNGVCGFASRVSLNLTAGSPVFVRVAGYGNELGNFQLVIQSRTITPGFTPTTTQTGTVPFTVAFADTSTTNAAGGITTRAWDFNNDGITDSTAASPSFTYQSIGTYSVRLTVGDAFGTAPPLTRTGLVVVNASPGDECVTATAVVVGTNGPFHNTGYTTSTPAWPCGSGGADRWFRFTVPGTGANWYRIRTCTPTLVGNTVLQVFAGGCASASVACNDNFAYLGCGNGSAVELPLTGGSTAYLRVGGVGASAVTFDVVIEPLSITAAFTGTPTSGVVPVTTAFTDTSTTQAAGGLVAWAWDFDNNGSNDSFVRNPSWQFANRGSYTVRLTVTDAAGRQATTTVPAFVNVLPAVGDDCVTATPLQLGANGAFTTAYYTDSLPTWPCGTVRRDRWFTFTAPCDDTYRFTPYNTALSMAVEVFGGTCSSLASQACGPEAIVTLSAGSTVRVRAGSLIDTGGSYSLQITRSDDTCGGNAPVAVGSNPVVCNTGFFAESPLCGGNAPDRWFRFVAPFAGTFTFSTSHNATIEVLAGPCGTLTSIVCGTTVAPTLAGGTTYRIRVGLPDAADFDLRIVPGKGNGSAASGLVINEFSYDDGAGGGEFVELLNTTATPLPIAGHYLVAVDAQGATTAAIVPATQADLPAGGHFVFGPAAIRNGAPGVDLLQLPILPDRTASLRLWDQSGQLVDTVAYAAGPTPLDPSLMEGRPLWGRQMTSATLPTSWSRRDGGIDTDDNGLDFRVLPATPGASNDRQDLRPWSANFDGGTVPRPVPDWSGGDELPQIVTPATPSPHGGDCAEYPAGPPGEGRSYMLVTQAADNFHLAADVWFDLPTGTPPGSMHSWSLGLCGTTDSRYELPRPWSTATDVNGDSGLTWTYQVTSTGGRLYLIDNGAGGADELVLRSWPITSPGWRRLALGVSGDGPNSSGSFQAWFTDVGTTTTDLVEGECERVFGGIYAGVRQAAGTPPGTFALRLDDVAIGSSARPETGGVGCDGNCRDRNRDAKLLDRSPTWEPATRRLAILVDQSNSLQMTATQVCFYMAKTQLVAQAPMVQAFDIVPGSNPPMPGTTALSNAVPLTFEGLGWWVGDITSASGGTFAALGPFFLVLDLDATVLPPVVRAAGIPVEPADYRLWNANTSSWGNLTTAAFAWKWTCTGATELEVSGTSEVLTPQLMPMVDLTVGNVPPAGLITALALDLAPLPTPFDLSILGAPCEVYVSPTVALFGIPIIGSVAMTSFPLPPVPLTGLSLHSQWFVLGTFNPLGVISSPRWALHFR